MPMLPAYVWLLIIASHTLLLIAAVLGIIIAITEWQAHQERKAARKLAEAMRRHPAGKGLQ